MAKRHGDERSGDARMDVMKSDMQQFREEVRNTEAELRLKLGQLAAQEAEAAREEARAWGLAALFESSTPTERRAALRRLVALVGERSCGGNSVEDIRRERRG